MDVKSTSQKRKTKKNIKKLEYIRKIYLIQLLQKYVYDRFKKIFISPLFVTKFFTIIFFKTYISLMTLKKCEND